MPACRSLGAGRGEGLPCGVSSATPQGKGGGGPPNHISPLTSILSLRGERRYFVVLFSRKCQIKNGGSS